MKYDYRENVKADILDYVKENAEDLKGKNAEDLYDELQLADSVTGNASGSYYCNTWKAEESLAHNWDLLAEACQEFGYDGADLVIEKGAEALDVIIRCYLVGQVLAELEDEINEILGDEE